MRRAYKDEQGHIDQHLPTAKEIARDGLTRAEYTYRNAIKTNVAGLKTELQAAISAPIPAAFTERLSFYRAAALTPTKTEAEALLQMAGKNPLAIRAVAKLLDDTKATVKIESRAVEQYEKDLDTLSELCEVMAGQPAPTRTNAGYKNIGNTWSKLALLTNGTFISTRIEDISVAADAWSADVTYQIREREHAEEVAKAKEEAENAGEEYKPEPEPSTSTTVTERGTDGVERAAEMGRKISQDHAAAAEAMKHYTK